jgi:thymidylate synthase
MKEYLDLVKEVLEKGEQKDPGDLHTTVGRTGVPTISYFGAHYKVDLAKGFPLLTTKKVYHKSILHELLWFLTGDTHIKDLKDKTKIWNAWTNEDKDWSLGQTYGHQWVKWDQFLKNKETGQWEEHHINQIQRVIDQLKQDPTSRRMVVSAWNPADFHRPEGDPKKTAQPSACHTMFMFHMGKGRKLNCHLTQRSGDLMLGIPFNLASYAALTQMIAQECDMKLGEFSHYINDCHIYENHIEAAREQLLRDPLPLPTLKIAKKPFWDLRFEDFELVNYNPHPPIKFHIAV